MSALPEVSSHLPKPREKGSIWLPPLFYAVVILLLLGSLLFSSGDAVVARYDLDMTIFICPSRAFAADQLRLGRVPLWNPNTFCGTPFVGNFQSAIFYPFTWLHVLLPMAAAINWTVAIEMFLAAWFMCLCARGRGIGMAGSLLAGLVYIFSGALYLRLYAGNLTILSTMTWAPLLLLCIDRLLATPQVVWALLAGTSFAMMLLAGSVPAVYITSLIFGIYALASLTFAQARMRIILMMLLAGVCAAGLSAVQVLPGWRASQEFVRAGGMNYELASACPVPPENIVTFIAPCFWDDPEHGTYIGRWIFWESTLYVGAAATVLAAAGMAFGPRRDKWPLIAAASIALILGMGIHVHLGSFNLFHFLFDHLPLFNRFRAVGRFDLVLAIFMALLAGMGVDVVSRSRVAAMRVGIAAIALSLVIAAIALWIGHDATLGADGIWGSICRAMAGSGQAATPPGRYADAQHIVESGQHAANQLGRAAAIIASVGILSMLSRKWPRCALAMTAVAAVELICFAAYFRASGPANLPLPAAWASAQATLLPGERVMHVTYEYADQGMADGIGDVYGYDALLLKRYAQLLGAAQQINPDTIDFPPPITQPFRLLELMRCRYVLFGSGSDAGVERRERVLPHLQLVDHYRVLKEHLEMLNEVVQPTFDASQTVLLESEPDPQPAPGPGAPGTAEIVHESAGELEITADLIRPAILLLGDAYSLDWRVQPTGPENSQAYRVIPADYAFLAVPLSAGKHHFLLEYKPFAFVVGKWITAFSVVAMAGALIWLTKGAALLRIIESRSRTSP